MSKRIVVVAAVLIAIAAMFWVFQQLRLRTSGTEDPVASESQDGIGLPTPIDDYLLFVQAAVNTGAVDDKTLIVDGLRKLAGAIGSLNLGTLDVQVRLRVAAEHVRSNSDPVSTGEAIRESLIAAAGAIEMGGDGELRRLAMSIQPDRPLTEQKGTFLEFFRTSAAALQRVSTI